MFLILKTTDWKEENYIKSGIVPFGWCEPLVEVKE